VVSVDGCHYAREPNAVLEPGWTMGWSQLNKTCLKQIIRRWITQGGGVGQTSDSGTGASPLLHGLGGHATGFGHVDGPE
jgi:hypothetical protein